MFGAIDIGNSKTDFVVLDECGNIHHWLRAGEITPTALTPEGTARALAALLPGGLQLDAPWVGAAGADFPDQEDALSAALRGRDCFGHVTVKNDIHALLACVRDHTAGIAVIAGAGMNAAGVHEGSEVRFAALGHVSGDRGGGGYIGRKALMAACRDADRRGPRTCLHPALLDHYQRSSMDEISRGLSEGYIDRSTLLDLTRIVFDLARQDDAVCIDIVRSQAMEVASFIRATALRMGCDPSEHPIALGGSILRYGRDLLEPMIRDALQPSVLDLQFPDYRPVVGAAAEVLRLAGKEPSLENLATQIQALEKAA